MKKILLLAFMLASLSPHAWAQKDVQKLQTALDNLQTMDTHFEQTLSSTKFGQEKASGQLQVKRPDQMRWLYNQPDAKVLLADGTFFHTFDALDKTPRSVPQRNLMDQETSFFFLWKKIDLDQYFTIQVEPAAQKDQISYTMIPKKKHADVKHIVLRVGFSPFQIYEIQTLDPLGQTNQLIFSQTKVNKDIAAKIFDFESAKKIVERKTS